MRSFHWVLALIFSCCSFVYLKINFNHPLSPPENTFSVSSRENIVHPLPLTYPTDTWQYFLQHLPVEDKPILDFRGNPIRDQEKHFAILSYDVGKSDLQQCADALMRIRSEYLFSRKKYERIGFYFNSGIYYSFSDYTKGIRPVFRGKKQILSRTTNPCEISHTSLRKWLDILYAYANTISLCKELIPASRLETGTVIIFPGHPGHCCMIMDAAIKTKSDTVFKIVEGYMPAQSIYVLSNPYEPNLSPWYHLGTGEINTASCTFRSYYLRKFE
jgi:hypothetical protein